MDKLKNLGWNAWFQNQLDAENIAAHELARVIAVHKERYIIASAIGAVFAELSGHLLYTADSPIDFPTTGDWVYADFYDDDTHAIIHGVIPRKTLLKRKTAGKLTEFQLIAANIDVALLMQSVDYNFNLRRLERYLVMVNEYGITPIILLSKCDLIPQDEIEAIKQTILNNIPQVTVLTLSSVNADSIETIKNSLLPAQTYCLLGSSGVGKTTLLNHLLETQQFRTQDVSKKQNKGKHTTTHRELIVLENGAMIIDTPGMRELGNISVDTGIDETFSDIIELAQNCKFSDCSHTNETGCAILSAIETGILSQQRYANYIKIKKESEFNEMSYIEKRKKDKDFGKMVKSVMKTKKGNCVIRSILRKTIPSLTEVH